MAGAIKYIKHKDIDPDKWDKAVENSVSPLIYAYSWYLEGMAGEQWDALVYGDYEAVFPLPWKQKYFLKYVYQPYFCQQLGLFASAGFPLSSADFIKAIPKKFILVDLQINLYNEKNSLRGRLRNNYQLDLKLPYNSLYNNYSQDVKNNLKKIVKNGVEFRFGIPYEEVIAVNRNAWGELNPGVKAQHYVQFGNLCREAQKRSQMLTIGAFQGNELLGAALLFKTPKFLFYVISGKTISGKKTGVMNGIVDGIVQAYADKALILDFEGSEIEGVAYFYKKFGSTNLPYLHFKKYNLF